MALPSRAPTRTTTVARNTVCDSLIWAASSSRPRPPTHVDDHRPWRCVGQASGPPPAGGPPAPTSQPSKRLLPPSPWELLATAAHPGPLIRSGPAAQEAAGPRSPLCRLASCCAGTPCSFKYFASVSRVDCSIAAPLLVQAEASFFPSRVQPGSCAPRMRTKRTGHSLPACEFGLLHSKHS